ncbi:IclR family transcriptional regulator C-terminal domain-containing protein [Actinacidiphila glaucinigra]|uniref:IclR family transcriptional regulator domain-containing protein n=1 Tax=Actinacidiphila glaucinigra TaxID=235986 RepID=UPI003679225D
MGIQQAGGERGGSRSSGRVFAVQAAFAAIGRPTARLAELAKASRLDDSVVSRILEAGILEGYFVRTGRGVYALGPRTAQMAVQASVAYGHDGDITSTHLQELYRATDKGLILLYMLAPFGGPSRQCVDMAVGDSDLGELGMTPRDMLAITRSLRTGAPGRAILAYLDAPLQQQVLATPAPSAAGPGALRSDEDVLASLAVIRETGYAVGYEECTAGWHSLAMPIWWEDAVMGSVVLLKPADVMPEPPDDYIDAMKTAVARLSRAA